jgi:hypothetical protein
MRAPTRHFQFVAGRYAGERPAIGCDGLVPGAALDLTHWQHNNTPTRFKADTSTEIALRFVASGEANAHWSDAVVVNNHFDTDGVLSVWVLLESERAVLARDLLVSAAEAGDFDEWPALDAGLKLDAAIRALAADAAGDEASYARVLPRVPELIDSIETRADLWGAEWNALQASVTALEQGRLRAEFHGSFGLMLHAPGQPEAPGALVARRFLPGARRYLFAFDHGDGAFSYRYERPRYAWAETVVRPAIPEPDVPALLRELGTDWCDQDLPGMTGVARTRMPIAAAPVEVIEMLSQVDRAS